MTRNQQTRREFLEESMLVAASTVTGNIAYGDTWQQNDARHGANNRLGVAVLGVRGRGASHLRAFAKRSDTQVVMICDPDQQIAHKRADEVEAMQGRRPQVSADLRRAFDADHVDLISIATPNHWHALAAVWAMQAGKDVYVEKPVSHNMTEGRRMVQASRRYGRICQAGMQPRSHPGLREAIEFLHQKKLGKVRVAKGINFTPRRSIGTVGRFQPPPELDYDLWLGPSWNRDSATANLHFDWQWQWAFGNGELGNRGFHQMDIARWGLGMNRLSDRVLSYGGRFGFQDEADAPNTQVVHHEYGDQSLVVEIRGLKTVARRNIRAGVIFECEEGYLVVSSYSNATAFSSDGRKLRTFSGRGDHFDNFVQAVRHRRVHDLHADIEQGHLSSALCHLANISYRLGRPTPAQLAWTVLDGFPTNDQARRTWDWTLRHLVENQIPLEHLTICVGRPLTSDSSLELVKSDDEANAMLTTHYRPPFVLPSQSDLGFS
ncbi:MAG TPA: Gfo/Idh/MocA family oxidoreductase [Planctomycetes bacterium]|nr:Gfo/Idh/MocA family oxidoreductase [Planctomycetota bacterium]